MKHHTDDMLYVFSFRNQKDRCEVWTLTPPGYISRAKERVGGPLYVDIEKQENKGFEMIYVLEEHMEKTELVFDSGIVVFDSNGKSVM